MKYDDLTSEIEKMYPGLLVLASDIYSAAEQFQYQLSINSSIAHELMGGALYARIVANYKSLLILCSAGMRDQSMAMLRVMIEAVFYIRAISNDFSFAQRYIDFEQHQRKNVLRKMAKFKESKDANDPDVVISKEVIKEISDDISSRGIKTYTTEYVAQKANLEDWYNTVYAYTSTFVHVSARSLESHLVVGEGDRLIELKNEPIIEGVENVVCPGSEIVIMAIDSARRILNIDEPSFLQQFNDKLRGITEKYA